MIEQRRKVEKEMKDAERLFERAKKDWQVTWREDERHTRDADRLAEQNNRKRERDQRDADRDLAQLEKLIERREKETAQRYAPLRQTPGENETVRSKLHFLPFFLRRLLS